MTNDDWSDLPRHPSMRAFENLTEWEHKKMTITKIPTVEKKDSLSCAPVSAFIVVAVAKNDLMHVPPGWVLFEETDETMVLWRTCTEDELTGRYVSFSEFAGDCAS